MIGKVPLVVVLVCRSDFPHRGEVIEQFVRRLYRDPDAPFAPSAAVPVVVGEISADGVLAHPFAGAERTAALVLLDDATITDTHFVASLDRLATSAQPSVLRVFPVPLTANATRLPNAVVQTNFLRFDGSSPDLQWSRIGSGLVHELCRWLQGQPRFTAVAALSEAPICVFLSHAKADGAAIASEFKEHLHTRTRLESFFDVRDIAPGFRFEREIELRIEKSILLVIRTDVYGTREWCQREVLAAKRAGVPILVVDALETAERRTFPYLGNVPTIRYATGAPERHERVLDLLLDETLRQLHFRKRVERFVDGARGSRPVVLNCAPELVRFALTREFERRDGARPRGRRRHVVYPDPPLSGPEVDVLAHDGERIRAESLTQFVARRVVRMADRVIAVSVSEAEDSAARGLLPLHQRDLIVELARHLFAAGARIAYGGDFRRAGFSELLVEVQRAHARLAGSVSPRIVSYVTEPLPLEARASFVDSVEFVDVARVEDPAPWTPVQSRAISLRAMRHQVARAATALVVVGGRASGFAGWRPGVAEEIAAATVAGLPVFLVGGFGGVASAYAEAVFRRGAVPGGPLRDELGPEPTGALSLPSAGEVVSVLRQRGMRNGLSKAENTQLAKTVDTDEIVALVLRGLAARVR